MKTKQAFAPYTDWEDWQLGMYRNAVDGHDMQSMIDDATTILRSEQLRTLMVRACVEMPISALVNLTNPEANHRPWLGQAACLLHCQSNESSVRQAWGLLTASEQASANAFADDVYYAFIQTLQLQPYLPGIQWQ